MTSNTHNIDNKIIIENLLNNSLFDLLDSERYLLENNSSERSITHRLAIIIESRLKRITCLDKYNVDCEYNILPGGIPKTLIHLHDDEIPKGKYVFPDIIIHRRGENTHNLLVLEIKKSTSSCSDSFDIRKIDGYVEELKYNFGLCIKIDSRKTKSDQPLQFTPTYTRCIHCIVNKSIKCNECLNLHNFSRTNIKVNC